MATLSGIYDLRYNELGLRKRVVAAIAAASQDILNEDDTTSNHENRVIWARNSLNNAHNAAEEMMWGVVGNASIQTNGNSSSDNDIQFVVNSLIDTFAQSGYLE